VLLECLTGAPEYPGSSAESAVARLSRPPRVPPTVPLSWTDLLTEMTADDPTARPSARQVARILHDLPTTPPPTRTAAADESVTRVGTKPITVAPQMPPPEPATVRSRQRRGAAWLVATGVLAAVLMMAIFAWTLPRGGSSLTPDCDKMTPATASTLQRDVAAVVSATEASNWDAARRPKIDEITQTSAQT
jgi:hypothetical protein